ncbi:MAG: TRAP transporter large permease subunit [Roseovarius sp.]|nr:TRAP transporter large permease subunit [Roseovarius sp.]MCY4209210.1 TRAP transporter large permease subunit [Roseovarius sp.]MCY4291144.1 TRAP transporter large permease subunit [Roseovarius sp.]MCY4314660.1 TRAP transporter large permease subunit [Roseovarius sp.]
MELFFLAILILTMALALGSGYPVAFALPGSAIISIVAAAGAGYIFADNVDAYFHSGGPGQWLTAGVTNLRGVYWEVERDTLIAIPLFIFMGIMLQKSKIAEDLLVTMARLFGPVPGGLGISVVFVGALLAATTGIVGATVVAMGLISLPAMLRNNYSSSLASGTIAASGTLGQIIPPSIVLIILADQLASAADQASTLRKNLHKDATGELSMPSTFDVTATSAGEMFLGAFVPGLVLVLLYMIFILIYALVRPKVAPPVPYEGSRDIKFWGNVFLSLVPPLTLIFMVLGSIISGIATVNQAGAIGASGALIMAGYRLHPNSRTTFYPAIISIIGLGLIILVVNNFNLNVKAIIATGGDMTGVWLGAMAMTMVVVGLVWSGIRVLRIDNTMHEVMIETAKTTSLVFIILLGAAMLTAAFRAFGGEELVRNFLNSLPGGFWSQFIIVMAVIFILGFFLDFIEIAVVVVPIVAPILLADPSANITAVWLGVMIGLNIQTSFLTPPFGFALFYLRGVAPAIVKTVQIYKGVIAFIILQLTALGIVGYYPQLVNYMPNRVGLLSETAPPPRNPKLQTCLEDYVRDKLALNRGQVLSAIDRIRTADFSVLPAYLSKSLFDSFDSAENAANLIDDIFAAKADVDAAAPNYRPIMRKVRNIEKEMRQLEDEAGKLRKQAGFLTSEENAERRLRMERKADEIESEHDALAALIPETWEETYKTFHNLSIAESKTRNDYRRSADNAVEAVLEFKSIISANQALFALEAKLRELEMIILEEERETAEVAIKDISSAFGKVAGADAIRSELSKARRSMRKGKENREKARESLLEAIGEYESQVVWRTAAANTLPKILEGYMAEIRDTIGSRSQERLSREQALYIAECNAGHKDISLNF